jgi:hypothetical protein
MKKLNGLKLIVYIACLACFILSCNKENIPEVIGESKELTAYEKYVAEINSGRIDSSAFLYTVDGGSIYYSTGYKSINKLDLFHNLVWKYPEGDTKELFGIRELIQLADGSIVFPCNKPSLVHSLAKLNKNGKLIWEKNFEPIMFGSLCQTVDKGFIFTGLTKSIVPAWNFDHYVYYDDWTVIKTDQRGNLEWSKTYGDKDIDELPQSIIQTEDNGYLIAVGEVKFNPYESRLRVIKLDQLGDIKNQISIPEAFYFANLIKANDDGYILTTAYFSPFDSNNSILCQVKIDNAGDIEWSKNLLEGGSITNIHTMSLLNTGYFIVYKNEISNKYEIIKTNNSGDLIE